MILFLLFFEFYRQDLLRVSAGENEPTVESSGSALTAAAWFDMFRIRDTFNHIPQTYLVVYDKAG